MSFLSKKEILKIFLIIIFTFLPTFVYAQNAELRTSNTANTSNTNNVVNTTNTLNAQTNQTTTNLNTSNSALLTASTTAVTPAEPVTIVPTARNPYRPINSDGTEIYGIRSQNISEVSNALGDIRKSADAVEKVIDIEVNNAIRESIDTIITENPNVPAFELQNVVFEERTSIYNEVDVALFKGTPTDTSRIAPLNSSVDGSLQRIETLLENRTGVSVDTSLQRKNISDALFRYQKEVEEKKDVIDNRGGDLLFKDSDNDGLSDYDETYIYGTDPENAFTVDGELNDSEKILAGFDPSGASSEKVTYEDARESEAVYVSDLYSVTDIRLSKKTENEDGKEKLVLKGRALPNSFVTLYIYSTPIVVTVKTDSSGEWTYSLDQELENGDHEVYVTTVDNSGKLIARSNPIPFTKSAEAATIGLLGEEFETFDNTVQNGAFRNNLLLVILAILLAGVIITLMFVGRNSNKTVVVEKTAPPINL